MLFSLSFPCPLSLVLGVGEGRGTASSLTLLPQWLLPGLPVAAEFDFLLSFLTLIIIPKTSDQGTSWFMGRA